jgi:adenylate cyclase
MLRFRVQNKLQQQEFDHKSGPIEIGRGGQREQVPRCIVQDLYVSKDHISLVEAAGGRVQIRNLSSRNSIRLADNSIIAVGTTRDIDSPVRLTVGETTIDIEVVPDNAEEVGGPLQTIGQPLSGRTLQTSQTSLAELGQSPDAEKLTQWFETVIAVQRSAAGSPEFYRQTAAAVVKLVGLDKGLVILRRNNRWMVQSRFPDDDIDGSRGREFSTTVLSRAERERRTFFQSEGVAANSAESLQGIEAVVASPIFDVRDQVVGMVYGVRNRFTRLRNGSTSMGIGPLEAQVMQLLASAVGVGLARQEQEAEAGRLRVQFEQFFSADLARELQRNPRLLDGQEREITVLFSDIRGFSRLSERLGPTETCRLVAYVMEKLTDRIREFEGVVVDYSGDGIMAMWNAPATQPEHAAKGCRAALGMIADLPAMDNEWKERLGVPLKLGIGLNTGSALCGNTGSTHKFKYGPLGHTVNLGSRVEGATKALGVPLLITGSTKVQLDDSFATRRLCKVRVVGIAGAVDLYELRSVESATPFWLALKESYEHALSLFEAGNFTGCLRALYALLSRQEDHHDFPSLSLVARAVEFLKSPPEHFDGILELVSK